LAQDLETKAASELFARVERSPAVHSLARRMEKGGVLSCTGVAAAAQPFLAALLHRLFPQRPIVLVTEGLRSQELAQQDLATWMGTLHRQPVPTPQPSTLNPQPLCLG
jgi:DNA-binding transcriptional LysR family regulator